MRSILLIIMIITHYSPLGYNYPEWLWVLAAITYIL